MSEVRCVACGFNHRSLCPDDNLFEIPCPRCTASDSLPLELEEALLDDEAWTDEEAAILYT